jgi:serine protease
MEELPASANVHIGKRLSVSRSFALSRLLTILVTAAIGAAGHAVASQAATVPGEVVVAYRQTQARTASGDDAVEPHVLHVRDVPAALRRLRRRPDVRYAVPNAVAHASEAFIPNDPGRGSTPAAWGETQWNFAGPASINAPDAWGNLIAVGRPGAAGVKIAVLDTGVAYRRFGKISPSPDLAGTRFAAGWDFVGHDQYSNDRNGHGTHVASTIAEATNNGIGLTGLAYGATIMPVKVLDDSGEGDAVEIARGVRFAAKRGAQVINLSLEFSADITSRDIPQLLDAIEYAHRRGALVVAASGNEAIRTVAYPARASYVMSVGSTTEHGCLSDFSNQGSGLDIVAPGGGPDAYLQDPGCQPDAPPGRNISQLTLTGTHRDHFGYPGGYQGTSMSVPHVSAAAAMVIASGVLGPHPAPALIERRLERTARDLGPPGYDTRYGFGLLDAGAATNPAIPVT